MKWIIGCIIVYLIYRWLTKKPKPTTVEEFREPPEEFMSIRTRPRNPSELIKYARDRGVIK